MKLPNEHFNKLTPAEDERLALLIEECGEVIQIAAKILRHGYSSVNPLLPEEDQVQNRNALEKELGHVMNAIYFLADSGDVHYVMVDEERRKKARSIAKWLHHQ